MSVYITDHGHPRSLHFLLTVSIKSFWFHYRQRYCHLALSLWGSAGAHLYRKWVCDCVQPMKADLLALVLLFALAGRTAALAFVRISAFHLWHCSSGGRDMENARHHNIRLTWTGLVDSDEYVLIWVQMNMCKYGGFCDGNFIVRWWWGTDNDSPLDTRPAASLSVGVLYSWVFFVTTLHVRFSMVVLWDVMRINRCGIQWNRLVIYGAVSLLMLENNWQILIDRYCRFYVLLCTILIIPVSVK